MCMGKVIRYRHKGCGFSYDFKEGVGFRLAAKEYKARTHMRNGDWGEKWKLLIEQYPDGTATYAKTLFYCEECNEYCTVPQIIFYIPKADSSYQYDESDYVPDEILLDCFQVLEKENISCPKCNREIKEMENLKKVPCLKCGQISEWKVVGHWD